MSQFQGFSEDFFRFFSELGDNNNRAWFTANKARYQAVVVEPMGRLISDIAPHLESISPHYVADPKPHGGSMFRIYRDTRFARDKTPYKTHAAAQFRHSAGRNAHAPGFYVHIQNDRVSFGGGVWRPGSKELGRIRAFIHDNPAAWADLVSSADWQRMGGLQGESLQRPPRGYDADSRHVEDLKRKSFYLMAHADPHLALSADLVTGTVAAFRAAAGLNHFVCDALELPF